MSFWAPAPKSPAENGILKKSLDTSLLMNDIIKTHKMCLLFIIRFLNIELNCHKETRVKFYIATHAVLKRRCCLIQYVF